MIWRFCVGEHGQGFGDREADFWSFWKPPLLFSSPFELHLRVPAGHVGSSTKGNLLIFRCSDLGMEPSNLKTVLTMLAAAYKSTRCDYHVLPHSSKFCDLFASQNLTTQAYCTLAFVQDTLCSVVFCFVVSCACICVK